MSIQTPTIGGFHRFMSKNMVYPIVLSTLLAFGIWIARCIRAETFTYAFLLYNLALAWIPYVFSLIVVGLNTRFHGKWWLVLLPFILWLIFFPNAPYVVTDLLHLDPRPPVPIWYDIGFFASVVWTGCLLAVVSLHLMQSTIRSYFGSLASWLFVTGTVVLSGLGIYLGRFLSWNSWDIFLNPQEVLTDVFVRVVHPVQNSQFYGVTFLFASFLLVCYVTFVYIQWREPK